ncbi:MAG: hypothetical protein HYT63_02905 [Candidatus Yanofskybacteria bacterium]|nr:hypothetical protein [Candidatus Yanofskybacteria bacterium]
MLTKNENITRSEYYKLVSDIVLLKKTVAELAKDQLTSSVIRKIEKSSLSLDKGLGKRFASLKEFKNYLRHL